MGPTSLPSVTPTTSPSRSPTNVPSSEPTITSFHWVACGRRGLCSGLPATLQNSNYERIGGTGSEIAIRCCSDTSLPGFSKQASSCPYAESFLGGVCYNSVSHHEAVDLCSGLGARLCTQAELDGNCARGYAVLVFAYVSASSPSKIVNESGSLHFAPANRECARGAYFRYNFGNSGGHIQYDITYALFPWPSSTILMKTDQCLPHTLLWMDNKGILAYFLKRVRAILGNKRQMIQNVL
ncbi:unnamed protein product [Cylindrotheca closterium]|uniref:Uncharacterized protein n=1 Tax=Cylindrotheca closterium TaxID=2856 RepID=A0AAD2FIX5_9STRA|nr:unnamed protein product [Cylindrotheca closterium]